MQDKRDDLMRLFSIAIDADEAVEDTQELLEASISDQESAWTNYNAYYREYHNIEVGDKTSFGALVKSLRKGRGLNQVDFAKIIKGKYPFLKMSQTKVSLIEKDDRVTVSKEMIAAFADFFGVEVGLFYNPVIETLFKGEE